MNWKNLHTRRISFLTYVALITGLAAIPPLGHADSESVITVGEFSMALEGVATPSGWEPFTFPKIPTHTQYTVVRDEGTTVVRAVSEAAASGLIRKTTIALTDYPILRWRWKVEHSLTKSDVRKKEGDDYAARIYITFAYDPDKVGFLKKAKYKIGRLLRGNIPIAALTYIWAGQAPKGMIVDNAYTDFVKMIVVESGDEKVGQWIDEERNVYEDYKRAFGEEPPPINAIAIMTDTDNTGEAATAYYGDIVFRKAQ